MLSKYVGASNILKEHQKNIMTGIDGLFINSFLVILKGQSIVHMSIKYVFTKKPVSPYAKEIHVFEIITCFYKHSEHIFKSVLSINAYLRNKMKSHKSQKSKLT